MPIIVQLGQCGNQIGVEVSKQLFAEGDRSIFFTQSRNGQNLARTVLVDMEPKVLAQVVNQKDFKFDPGNVIR